MDNRPIQSDPNIECTISEMNNDLYFRNSSSTMDSYNIKSMRRVRAWFNHQRSQAGAVTNNYLTSASILPRDRDFFLLDVFAEAGNITAPAQLIQAYAHFYTFAGEPQTPDNIPPEVLPFSSTSAWCLVSRIPGPASPPLPFSPSGVTGWRSPVFWTLCRYGS